MLPLAAMSLLGSSGVAPEEKCKEKATTCENRVEVLVTDLVFGLKDEVPVEVYEAFVTASSQCLSCVDKTDVNVLKNPQPRSKTGDNKVSLPDCKKSGCWCCQEYWCSIAYGTNYCPSSCSEHYPQCFAERRQLTDGFDDDTDNSNYPYFVNYELNVCMEDITPLDPSATSYVDHTEMLADLERELATCYEDKDAFLDSWSSLCADSGIDLSLMARQEGEPKTILFGANGLDSEHAVVTTYSSDESHQSTSHMIFYSALGFVAVSAFAVVGTAVVVKVLNKRRAAGEEQAAQWVSEMTNVETSNSA